MDLRAAIICILENGGMVDVMADLTAYKYGDHYCVEYWYNENSIAALNLTDEQRKVIKEDEELVEFFDTPEEAADFCLKISNGQIASGYHTPCGKRSLEDKLASVESDEYF